MFYMAFSKDLNRGNQQRFWGQKIDNWYWKNYSSYQRNIFRKTSDTFVLSYLLYICSYHIFCGGRLLLVFLLWDNRYISMIIVKISRGAWYYLSYYVYIVLARFKINIYFHVANDKALCYYVCMCNYDIHSTSLYIDHWMWEINYWLNS